jgi:tartrate-resistant acid phosphatase type 5
MATPRDNSNNNNNSAQDDRGNSLSFLVLGDWGGSGSKEPQVKIAEQMGRVAGREDSRFILALGDNFYRRGVSSVDDERFKESFEDVYSAASLQVPWFVIAGNRDHKGNIAAQIEYTQASSRWNFPSLYYSQLFRVPGTHITVECIFLDTMLYIGPNNERQDIWLEDCLKKSRADWVLVCGHHPVFSAGRHGPTARLVDQLQPLLEKYRVAAYLCGHDHNLQHIRQDGSKVDYFVSGAGYETCVSRKYEHLLPEGSTRFFWPPQQTELGGFMGVEILDKKTMIAKFYDYDGNILYTTTKCNPRYI